jgi:ABC-type glycerol-3-phosphate transport system substrate-binding protein
LKEKKMKRLTMLFSVVLVAAMLLAACATPAPTEAPVVTKPPATAATEAPATQAQLRENLLNVWSFTNEIMTMAIAFEGKHPDVDVVYTMIPMTNGEYQTKLMATLGTNAVPDVVALEAAFVKSYVESDFLSDLSDLMPYAEELKVYPFVYEVGTYDGIVKAYSYQATPGALFYRRSLAKEYFGTDDPAQIQELLSDMDKYIAAAQVVKEKSGGNTYMVASNGDFMNLFYATREQPWVVDNTLTVDPMVDKMVETVKPSATTGMKPRQPNGRKVGSPA